MGALDLRSAHRPIRPQEALPDHPCAVYTVATVLTAFSPNPAWYFACRFLTGAGIGGEYAAINSAIDELIPAHYRGRVDIVINGSFWVGAVGGALLTIPLLDPTLVNPAIGWRLAFGLGALLAVGSAARPPAMCRRARAGCSSTVEKRKASALLTRDRGTGTRRGSGPARAGQGQITIRQRRSISIGADRPHGLHALPAAYRCCASRCSSARRSCTTPSSSPTATR